MLYGEKKMGKYVVNAFSPSMLNQDTDISFQAIDREEFCKNVADGTNAIGHDGTVTIINTMCGTHLQVNRITVHVQPTDVLYIFGINTRLPEGKVLDKDELDQLLKEGKIRFWKATVFPSLLTELAKCGGKCDEAYYDHLAFLASGQS